jgi:hypothetical protein
VEQELVANITKSKNLIPQRPPFNKLKIPNRSQIFYLYKINGKEGKNRQLISVLDDESIDITEKDRIIEDVCSLGDQSVIKILTDRFYLKNIPLQEKLSLAISLGRLELMQ